MIEGRCLCGAVRVRTSALAGEMSACFCANCQRWGGGVQMGVDAPVEDTEVSGPVKTFRAVSFAERAWCDRCGSSLWLRDDDGPYEFCPGLFENAGGARLTRIVYADRKPDGWDIADTPDRLSAAAYEQNNKHASEGDMP